MIPTFVTTSGRLLKNKRNVSIFWVNIVHKSWSQRLTHTRFCVELATLQRQTNAHQHKLVF